LLHTKIPKHHIWDTRAIGLIIHALYFTFQRKEGAREVVLAHIPAVVLGSGVVRIARRDVCSRASYIGERGRRRLGHCLAEGLKGRVHLRAWLHAKRSQ